MLKMSISEIQMNNYFTKGSCKNAKHLSKISINSIKIMIMGLPGSGFTPTSF